MNEKCFALKKVMTRTGNCACRDGCCPGYSVCPFYKPVWKFEHDLELKYAKLAALPEMDLIVNSALCAGVTPQKHEAALETMRSCQIVVK